MKKSFMTRVLAVTLSTAMAFSVSSAGNLMTASAAGTKPYVALKTKFKTLTVGQKYKMTLKNNSLKWRIKSATSSDKKIVNPYKVKSTYVKLKAKAEGRVKVTYKLKTAQRKTNNTKTLKGTVKVKAAGGSSDNQTTTFSISAEASSPLNVKVTFSQAIDDPASVTKDNFTVNNNAEVRNAVVSEDGKTADLQVYGATYDTTYEVTVTGVKVAGEEKSASTTFKTPSATEKYKIEVTSSVNPIKSDGMATSSITCEVIDTRTGQPVSGGVSVEFSATLGSFSTPTLPVENGKVINTYNSASLESTRTDTIVATVVHADDKDLEGQYGMVNVTLMPNPGDIDTTVGAIVTNVVAPTADRVIAYFNKPVEAKDFRTASGALNDNFTATVTDGVDSSLNGGDPNPVIGVLDVVGDDTALQLLVQRPMKDNTTIKLEFRDSRNRQAGSVIDSVNTVACKLADGTSPELLKVEATDSRTLEVTFSEAVLPREFAPNEDNYKRYAADLINNYMLDNRPLSMWGVEDAELNSRDENEQEANAVVKESSKDYSEGFSNQGGNVTVGVYRAGVDKRSVVTIKLPEDRTLPTGTHSLQVANVGDWAASADGWRNIVHTGVLSFEVTDNQEAPDFELNVMSPEQYKLTANCELGLVDAANTTFTAERSNITSGKTCIVELQEYRNGRWQTISADPDDDTRNPNLSDKTSSNPIMVSRVRNGDGSPTNEYIVETTKDWSVVLNTRGTNKDWRSYRYCLHIPENTLRNLSNGLTNGDIRLELATDDKSETKPMTYYDTTSPEMTELTQVRDDDGSFTNKYEVTFNRPMKMSIDANKEGMTPLQEAQSSTQTSAVFIKGNTTVPANITTSDFINAYDTKIRIEPTRVLEPGEWELSVRALMDDIGNSLDTRTFKITVPEKEVSSDFKVVWAAVSADGTYGGITSGEGHYVLVKFNQPINLVGTATNAGYIGNYQLDGAPLPTGTNILEGIDGYDRNDKYERNSDVVDSITIVLPQSGISSGHGITTMDYTVNGNRSILSIANDITNKNGVRLSVEPGYDLPYQFGEWDTSPRSDKGDPKWELTQTGDAVWGNADSERYDGNLKSYISRLKAALENDKYREVRLDPAAQETIGYLRVDLDINRIVDLDLNGCNIKGNVNINSTVEACPVSIKDGTAVIGNTSTYAYIEGVDAIDKDKDATLTVNTPNTDFQVVGVTVKDAPLKDGSGDAHAIIVNGVPRDTFYNYGVIESMVIAGNNIGFENDGEVTSISIDTTSTVDLKGNYGNTTVNITRAATLVLSDVKLKNDNFKINASAANAKIRVPVEVKSVDGSSLTFTISSTANNVEVITNSSKDDNIKLEYEGGSFVQKNLDGKEKAESEKMNEDAGIVQGDVNKLHFINGSTMVGNIEYVTASVINGTVSGGALLTAAGGGNDLLVAAGTDYATKELKVTSSRIAKDSAASHLAYDAAKHSITISPATAGTKEKFYIYVTIGGKSYMKIVQVTFE